MGHSIGVVMALMFFALIGCVSGWTFKWPVLLLIVSVLAMAIGLEGALHRLPLASVLTSATLMLVVTEGAFFVSAFLKDRSLKFLAKQGVRERS